VQRYVERRQRRAKNLPTIAARIPEQLVISHDAQELKHVSASLPSAFVLVRKPAHC
jgi:hypothetical protein